MMTNEELERYKAEFDRLNLSRARRQAVVIVFAVIITILSLVYAFVQRTTAERANFLAASLSAEGRECALRTEKAEQEALQARKDAEMQSQWAAEMQLRLENEIQKGVALKAGRKH